MSEFYLGRRSLLRGAAVAVGGAGLSGTSAAAPSRPSAPSRSSTRSRPETDPHTQLVYAAVVDAVVPRTPELRDTLGPEHVPGGLEIGLDAYLVTYINNLFSGLSPVGDRTGNLRLAEPVALILEEAAAELVATGGNEKPPSTRFVRDLRDRSATVSETVDVAAAGLFPRLSRQDRLNALTLLDRKEVDTTALTDRSRFPLFETDGGLIPTLVVGFTEVVYYSGWQGFEDITVAPSEREFTNDPRAVQSWRQTDFPEFADGYNALRGYWGRPNSSLGEGRVWKVVKAEGEPGPPNQITFESGDFRENDYDTSDYEEPFSTDGTGDGDGTAQVGGTEGSVVDAADEQLGDGDGSIEVGEDEGGLLGTVFDDVTGPFDGGARSR